MTDLISVTETQPINPRFSSWLADTNDLMSRNVEAHRIPGLVNLGGGLPDPSLLPVDALAKLASSAMSEHPQDCFGYGPVAGLPALREAIAQRYRALGVPASLENVIVTTSGSQTLDLLGKIFVSPGDTIACELPSYAGAFDAWRPRSPRYRHLGLRAGENLATRMVGAAFTYMIPNFSNPTGYLVTEEERLRLLAAARMTGTPLVEDDPYGLLFYDGEPLPTLLQLASVGRNDLDDCSVLQLGTLSKQLAPGLRIGWMVGAPAIIRALTAAKQATDLCSNGLAQCIAVAAMEEGLIEHCHPRIISRYRARRDALCTAMACHVSDWFSWEKPIGGMFVWATARDRHIDLTQLVDRGMREGVLVGPSHPFDPLGKSPPAIRLCFTFNPEDRLELGITRLVQALRHLS